MTLENKVWEIMTSDLITVTEETPISELKNKLRKNQIHHLPVVDDKGNLLGIISSEDFIRTRHFNIHEKDLMAKHIMTVNPTKVGMNTSIRSILDQFLENRYRAIPIVDEEKDKIVGIITPFDVINVLRRSFAKAG